MKKETTSILLAGLATLCWATVASAFKLTLKYIRHDVLSMVFFASAFSTMVFLFILIVRKHSFQIKKTRIIHSALLGLINPAIYYIVLFKAYDLLPGQQAQPLNYTWPIMLTLLSVLFLGQTVHLKDLAGIFISFFGVILISLQGNFQIPSDFNLPGLVLALGSSILWATFWILNMRDSRSAVEKLFWNFLFGTIVLAMVISISGRFVVPSLQAWAGIAWIGLFEMGITFILWMKALDLCRNPVRIANIVYLSPFISLFFLNRIIGESISWASLSGLLFIVLGILIKAQFVKIPGKDA